MGDRQIDRLTSVVKMRSVLFNKPLVSKAVVMLPKASSIIDTMPAQRHEANRGGHAMHEQDYDHKMTRVKGITVVWNRPHDTNLNNCERV